MKRPVKVLLVGLAVLLVLFLLPLLIAVLVYPPEYIYRLVAWGNSDYGDYINNFSMSYLEPASEPFTFTPAPDSRVAKTFAAGLGVDDFPAFLAANDTQAFIVIQDDQILFEQYFNGMARDTLLTSFSTAKSFDSALVGIAIAEGYINSVEDPITTYLPELAERDPRFNDITVRHLLLMASGLEYQGLRPALFNSDDFITSYYTDQRKAALEFTNISDPPGQYFLYNKYHPQLLGLILERTTGRSVTDYTQEKLWDPLGMEYGGGWSLDSTESGFEKMEAGLNARAIDYAKLGRLYLHNGNWNGKQVVPAEWVAESTQPDPELVRPDYYPDEFGQLIYDQLGGYYQYMWYGYLRDGVANDFAAEGDHGQYIYVSPHKNLIIVRNGLEYGAEMTISRWIELFYAFASDF
jgi:CubicO group peptidase (beta-lactamase class C family)